MECAHEVLPRFAKYKRLKEVGPKSLWRARESGMMIVYWCLLIVNRSNMIVDDVDVHVDVVVVDDDVVVVDDDSLLIVKHGQTWSN